jgi:hypothetical protein
MKIRWRLTVWLLWAAAGIGAARAQMPVESLYGQTVLSVSYRSDGAVEKDDVERLITIRVGSPLTDTETAQTGSTNGVIACYEIILEQLKSVSGVSQGKRQKECNRQSDK